MTPWADEIRRRFGEASDRNHGLITVGEAYGIIDSVTKKPYNLTALAKQLCTDLGVPAETFVDGISNMPTKDFHKAAFQIAVVLEMLDIPFVQEDESDIPSPCLVVESLLDTYQP